MKFKTTFETIKLNVLDLIKYQKWLASANGIQLTTWEALKAGIASTIKVMAKWLLTTPAGWATIAITAIVGVVAAVNSYNEAIREGIETANEANSTTKETITSLEDYKKTIDDLKKSLDSGVLSEEDAYDARKQLMTIQDDLIKNFGLEKDAIDLVNGGLKEQIALLDNASRETASNYLRENKKAIEDAKKTVETKQTYYAGIDYVWLEDLGDFSFELDEAFDGINRDAYSFDFIAYNKTADEAIQYYTDLYEFTQKYKEENKASLGQTEKGLENIDHILSAISDKINKINNEDYKNAKQLYETATEYLLVTDSAYRDLYADIVNAKNNYQEAVTKDNQDGIKKSITALEQAYSNYQDAFNQGLITDTGVSNWFEQFYNDFQTESRKYQFKIDVEANVDNLDTAIQIALGRTGKTNLSKTEVLNLEFSTNPEDIQAFNSLNYIAEQYGLTVEGLIPLLQDLGYVQKEITNNHKKNTEETKTLSEIIETVSEKTSAFAEALSEIEESGEISGETYANLISLNKNYAECFTVVDGKIQLIDGWREKLKELETQEYLNEKASLAAARAELTLAMAREQAVTTNRDTTRISELQKLINEVDLELAALDSEYKGLFNVTADDGGTDPIKAAFEKEYNEWQHLISTGEATVDEFITWLDQEYKDTFSDLTKYQEEYNKYEEEVYNARKKREQELFDLKISNHETLAEILTDGVKDSEIKNFNETMQSIYGLGNVDLTKRPMVNSDTMRKAGYDVEDGSTATVYSGLEFLKQGDKYVAVHYTPILPDGTVLDKNTLYDYLDNTLNGSQNILDADNKGIILKVDSGFEITEEDIKSLEDGIPTENISNIIKICDEWDVSLHDVQASWVELQNAINGDYSVSDELRLANEQLNYALGEIDTRIAELRNSGKTDVDEEIQELLDKKQSIRDTIDNNNVSIVENEKTYWENLKQEVEDYYDKEIEKLQSILDEEEKINKQEELRNNLIKARQDLENAKKNRNQLVFANGSFEYTVDQEAVEQAVEAEKDARRELERFEIEQDIKELDEQRNEKLDAINAVIEKVDEHLKELNGEIDPTSSDSEVISKAGATDEANKAQNAHDSLSKDDKSDTSTEVKTDTVVVEQTGQPASDNTGIQGTKQLYTIDEAAKILADRLGVSVDSDIWKNFATSVVSNGSPQSSPLSGIQNQNVYNNSTVDNSIRIGTINNNVTVAEGTTKQQVQSMLDGFASEVVGSLKSLRTKTT